MYSSDDIQYALETTRVVHEPDRRIDTFGSTRFQFQLLSELMDDAGKVRIRSGEVDAARPQIVCPEPYQAIEMDGFGDEARERLEALMDRLKAQGVNLAFMKYGFRFRRGEVREELVSDSLEAVSDRVVRDAERQGNPLMAVIEGVDDAWEISILKFTLEMILKSQGINEFDFKRRGLL
jgi:hypothetical protein